MNKIIFLLFTVSALITFTNGASASYAEKPVPESAVFAIHKEDLRVKALENVFDRYNSPLKPYAANFIDAADKYDVDWRLLPAIAGLESSFGKRQLSGSYNSYGWGGGRIYFESVEDGIDVVLTGLKTRYMNRGATTVETIAPIYSESSTWAPRIRLFMNQIEAEYARLGMHSLELTI